MGQNTRLVHFTVIDGTNEEIIQLQDALKQIKDKLDYDLEFLITNDRVESVSVENLLSRLIKLYKKDKKVKK